MRAAPAELTTSDRTTAAPAPAGAASDRGPFSRLLRNAREPLPLLLIQIVVILAAARGMGALFVRLGQPSVVGEMVAGILLGPSLFGLLAPAAQAALFPAASMGALRMLSQVGVIVFMFVVGVELDLGHLARQSHAALLVSHTSILVPGVLGMAFALAVYGELAPAGVSFRAFALFFGAAMSMTAFPVLARILEERGLSQSPLGVQALACAAITDASAWCLLALIVALGTPAGPAAGLETALFTLVFVALMFGVVRPVAARVIRPETTSEAAARTLLAVVLACVLLCAFVTEVIGIHALFGAFVAGAVLPSYPSVHRQLKTRLESFSAVALLPLFFASTGLHTEIGLIHGARNWMLCLLVIALATVGKVGGTSVAARVTGSSWPDAFALGALMNTRGLVELIVLDLGYNLGILSPSLFAMMVVMAITTTVATGPLLALHQRWVGGRPSAAANPSQA